MDNSTQQSDRSTTEKEFLQNGIPSIVLAIVTVFLTVYSIWVVQPSIQESYRSICESNFAKLGLVVPEPTALATSSVAKVFEQKMSLVSGERKDRSAVDGLTTGTSNPGPEISVQEQLKLLLETQLRLRRLAIMDQASDLIRIKSALVSTTLSEWYRDRAWDANEEEAKSKEARSIEVGQYLASERSELGKAMDSLRAAQRLEGPYAQFASTWIIESQLNEASFYGGKELAKLEATVSKSFSNSTAKDSLGSKELTSGERAVWGKIIAMRALRFGSDATIKDSTEIPALPETTGQEIALNSDQKSPSNSAESFMVRNRLLKEAGEYLEQTKFEDLDTVSWIALSKLPTDNEKGRELAWGAVQDFWSSGTIKRPRSEDLNAVMRGLMVGGNLEEAQSFVMNQLKKLPPFEQTRFRQLVADTCLRQFVTDYLVDHPKRSVTAVNYNPKDYATSFTILDLAVRLNPEIDGLPTTLIHIGSTESDQEAGSLTEYVRQVIETSKRDGLNGICKAVSSVKSRDIEGIRKAIELVCQDDLVYGVVATKVAMSMISDDTSHEYIAVWLKTLNEFSPDVLAAWFARGDLMMKMKNFPEARVCFEHCAKKMPENEQIREMLLESSKH